MIADCPSIDYIPEFTTKVSKEAILKDGQDMTLIVHSAGEGVLEDERYKEWICQFGEKTHHIILSPDYCNHDYTFHATARNQIRLAAMDPKIFIPPYQSSQPLKAIDSGKKSLFINR
jgi:ribonuclease Z